MKADTETDSLLGKCIENYEISFVLGKGSFATVYKARDVKLGRNVAIKFLHASIGAEHEDLLQGEAKAIAALGKHPGIVQIYTWGEYQSRSYFVLEFVASNVEMLLQYHPSGLPLAQGLAITKDCAEGLTYAHKQGILHRDIKPANVLLELEGGHAKLADFGMARFIQREDGGEITGGTPAYMAPEVARGGTGTPRSDVYSLGVSLYEMLCGKQPFEGDTAEAIMARVRDGAAIPLRGRAPDLGPDVLDLVSRAMAPDPDARFPSAEAFAAQVQGVSAHQAAAVQPALQAGSVTPDDVGQERIMAAMAAQAAKHASAKVLAPERLEEGIEAFRDGEAHNRLKQYAQAKDKYTKAKEQFDAACRRADKVLAGINALKHARARMEAARKDAENLAVAHLAEAKYQQAIEVDRLARATTKLAAATRLYDEARALYEHAREAAIREGAAIIAAARFQAEAARRKATLLEADQYAPGIYSGAEEHFNKAGGAMPDVDAAKRYYSAARAGFGEAVRETFERKRHEEELRPRPAQVFAGIEFVWIPPGAFLMGSTHLGDAERPVHEVTISRGFWMSACPITQDQWRDVMGDTPAGFTGDGRRPVESVSWDQCQEFVRRLLESGAGVFHLPTEAQWEYACRAGKDAEFHFGDDAALVRELCWSVDSAGGRTHPVGGKEANAWGLHDMQGNVSEWCWDTWHPDYAGAPNDGSARIALGHTDRVVRGGSWCVVTQGYESARRNWFAAQDTAYDFVGFRICRDRDWGVSGQTG